MRGSFFGIRKYQVEAKKSDEIGCFLLLTKECRRWKETTSMELNIWQQTGRN
jgi:hypothetical protein